MSLLGLYLNATCVRAVCGPLGDYPVVAALEPPRHELPAVVCLEGRASVLGSAGLRVCRKAPQQARLNFLPLLGETPQASRKWLDTRQRLDTARAVTLLFQHVLRTCQDSVGTVLALPAYLSTPQVEHLLTLADQAGLHVLGSINAPLAAALTAHAEQAWFGSAVVLDLDDHAFTLATVGSAGGQAQLLDLRLRLQLGWRVWRERLLNALADCCILDSRWDPREAPAAEQALFDQLDGVFDAAQEGRMVKLTMQTPQRFQNLVLQARDPAAFCSSLRRQLQSEVEAIMQAPWPGGAPGVILVTAAVARLPGVVADLQARMSVWAGPEARKVQPTVSALEDFGTHLLDEPPADAGSVVILSPDAPARGAHAVAAYFQRGDIPCGHLQTAAPLPLPQPLAAGPARLHFQGRDYLLGNGSFLIGRQPGLDLVFDADHWPKVSARHCEIVFDHRAHMLRDRSREGTLINDCLATETVYLRAGDWIRLGPDGPLLRFLGQTG